MRVHYETMKQCICAFLILAILLALASRLGPFGTSLELDRDAIVPESGYAYTFRIPYPSPIWHILVSGDNPSHPTLSSLVLTENGRVLGPPHSVHEAIRTRGMGAFSHWGAQIIFSSLDNRDPRTSGAYVARIPLKARLDVIFGLALLLAALNLRALPVVTTATLRLASRPVVAAIIIPLLIIGSTEFIARSMIDKFANPREALHLYNPYRGHELNPNDGSVLHSSDGFRSNHAIARTKPLGTFRIIALGGSALYGISAGGIYPSHPALPNDKTVTAFLEARINSELQLRGETRRVEVVNAGVTGYETFQHLVYANEILVDYQPDLFIFFDGWNDWFRADPIYSPWKRYPYSSVLMTSYINHPSILISAYLLAHALASYSNFAELVFRVLHVRVQAVFTEESSERRKTTVPQLYPSLAEAERTYARRTFLLSYGQITKLSRLMGAQMPVVFLQPVITFEEKSTLSAADQHIYNITSSTNPSLSAWRQLRVMLPELFAADGIEFHDIGQIGNSAEAATQLYIDYCHLSPEGAQRAAELMYPALMRRVEIWLGESDHAN
jgi:lysophospholipase L1-like esterase